MVSESKPQRFQFGIRNLIITMVAVSLWMAAIFNSHTVAFIFSLLTFVFVIAGNAIMQWEKEISKEARRFFLISAIFTGLILMVMIGHQSNQTHLLEDAPAGSVQNEEIPWFAKDDPIAVWRLGMYCLPICHLAAALIAYIPMMIRLANPRGNQHDPAETTGFRSVEPDEFDR